MPNNASQSIPVTIGELADRNLEDFRLYCKALNVPLHDCHPHAATFVAMARDDRGFPRFACLTAQNAEDVALILALNA